MPMIQASTGGNYINWAERLALSNPNRTPILSNLIARGQKRDIRQDLTSWKDWMVENTKTSLTAPASIGDTTLTVADSSIFLANTYAVVNNEVLKVTATPTATTITVLRAQSGTSATALNSGDIVFLIADGKGEGSLFGSTTYKDGISYTNYSQIFITDMEISGTALVQNALNADGKSKWELEQEKKTKQHEAKIEKMIMQGVPSQSLKLSGGLRHWLNSGNSVVCGSFATDFYGKLNELCLACYEKGADLSNGTYALIVPPGLQYKINNSMKDYVLNNTTGLTELGQTVSSNKTAYGSIPLIMSNNLSESECYLVDLAEIELIALNGSGEDRTLKYVEMGVVGDKKQATLLSEMTLEVRSLHLQGKLVGITS